MAKIVLGQANIKSWYDKIAGEYDSMGDNGEEIKSFRNFLGKLN